MDDILIVSKSFEEHLEHLDIVLNKLRKANLVLKQSKCEFIKSEIKFLGHVINADGISTDPAKIDSFVKFSTPRKVKDVRAFHWDNWVLSSVFAELFKNNNTFIGVTQKGA